MHVLDGFNYLLANGYADAARIALIHSFALQDVTALQGYWDGVPADRTRLSELLGAVTYTDEDRLFQLCDILGGADGFCVLEEWLMEVALRIGMTERTLDKSERNWL